MTCIWAGSSRSRHIENEKTLGTRLENLCICLSTRKREEGVFKNFHSGNVFVNLRFWCQTEGSLCVG